MCRACVSPSFFFFKQKTAYEMRISDWSSDVCSSDLGRELDELHQRVLRHDASLADPVPPALRAIGGRPTQLPPEIAGRAHGPFVGREAALDRRSEERRGGQGCVRPCRSRWSPDTSKQKHR